MSSRVRHAARMDEIEPFRVMELLARAKALEARGRSVVHMEVGEPDFSTPEPIVRAGQEALARGLTHYTPAAGLPELREAIARDYRERWGVDVAPERVVVTPGASGALNLLMGVLIGPGDEVLLADPGYPCNRHFVRLAEGRPVSIPVGPASAYQLTAERVAPHLEPSTRAVLLASPANPTGTLIAPGELARIHAQTRARGVELIVDEIYQGLVYAGPSGSALALGEDVFVVNSFSKYFGMTGWRLGWLVAPEAYIGDLERLAQNIFLAAPTPAQHAALAAFRPDTRAILEERRETFRARRDYLLPAVRGLGMEVAVAPEGAFYLYADCGRYSADSYALCLDLLEHVGVAITPGIDFGRHQAATHVRFAYTTGLDRLREGVRRIAAYLERSGVA